MPQPTVDHAMQLAIEHHQAGRLGEAEAIYRQILAIQPNHPDSLNLLGVLAGQVGRNDLAADLIQKAISASPANPVYHFNLGTILHKQSRFDQAVASFKQALALRPDYAQAYDNLGNTFQCMGLPQEAIPCHQQAITIKPDLANAHFNLANALRKTGQLDQAIDSFNRASILRPNHLQTYIILGDMWRDKGQLDNAIASYLQALSLKPDFPEIHYNIATAFKDKGKLDDAIMWYQRAVNLKPDYFEAHINLGNVLRDRGRLDDAITSYQQALPLRPNDPEPHNNLGTAWYEKGERDKAITCYRQALDLDPNHFKAHYNLANAFKDANQLDQAIASYQQALKFNPDFFEAHNNLGNTWSDKGEIAQAITCFRQTLAINPNFIPARSNLIFTLHYLPDTDPHFIAEEHRRWNRQHAEPLKKLIQPHLNDRNPDRRLRIGYVSPDFRVHPVAPMVLPLIESHDHERFQIFCYGEVPEPDAMTERFRAHADQWHNTVGLSDDQLANLIRQDQIDILVDLAGHTIGNRLLVFARKPAPVQVARQGYPNTTGLSTIDYRMSDTYADPPGLSDTLHTEKIFRLPQTNWIYQPPENCPPPIQRPLAESVQFGCFNNFAKVTDPMLNLWARLLAQLPNSTLMLKAKNLALPEVQQRVRQIFQAQSIPLERLKLVGWERSADNHLALYNQIAIGLDPFPYHGTTSTCEALWMGVPVITLAGQAHVSRVGVSLLTNMGLGELIAETPDEYIRIAVQLANDLPRLNNLHLTLRQRMSASPLMDAPKFARNIESAYRQMWQTWCAQDPALR